ncbi:hypothetical protein DTW90_24500 [Neorhizobium sp. P12A]|uniref:hypothetical protein n=1 Tax=Neorhizobium sp. P12A TaxID=2268027 RepID=UPI0011F00FC9|nr:hypothetical protein [Neorhizobium sp. P12A]KAA0694479.1 hypothetical protein DTW90_24500 [Neorhizobium sp. P12A]
MTKFRYYEEDCAEPPYVLIRLYKASRGLQAVISKSEDLSDEGYSWPDPGCDAEAALAWAANYAGINAVNVYIQLDHVDWEPSWGEIGH